MALALLAHRWAQARGGKIIALNVDHGLRPEAAHEALQVKQWMASHGIAHHTLHWQGEKPATGLQAAARKARYRLLEDFCAQHGILHLLLGHHGDDQAITFWQRLAHGSSPIGLASMAMVREKYHLRLIRPLLGFAKQALQEWLRLQDQPWIEDPSNQNPHHQRNRLQPLLESEGLKEQRLQSVIAKCARTRQALEQQIHEALVAYARLGEGACTLLPAALALPEIILQGVLQKILCAMGGKALPCREEKLRALHHQLLQQDFKGATLHGCQIRRKKDVLFITPAKSPCLEKTIRSPHIRPLTEALFWPL
jgi:tRNA(Ile)-lysidine synthase